MNNIFHVIKDPVHGTMQFTSIEDAWVKPFIDSPNFQRLRHIKQLGLGDYIFPGAVHSRFNHCLGCCYVASQIAHKIGLADEERQLVMIACLLHDVGHGPFSHAFEGIFQQKLIKHEDWTPYFLYEFSTDEFFQDYNRINPRHRLTAEKFHDIANMIMHQPKIKNVSADIVSSQLDADRLDYLLRDSHFCGVRYGEFDFRWMLHCLAIVADGETERLGITHKGIGAVEHYLMARRLMLRNIYHSQKKLALEFFLVKFLALLAESIATHPTFNMLHRTKLGKFLLAANELNQIALQKTKQKQIITDEKKIFLQQNYSLYKELCDYDVFSIIRRLAEIKEDHPVVKLATRLHKRQMPKIIRLDDIKLKEAEIMLQQFREQQVIADWQLTLIRIPHQSYSDEDDPILVVNEQGRIKSISDFSLMINAISDKFEHVAFLCVDQEIAEKKAVLDLITALQLLT